MATTQPTNIKRPATERALPFPTEHTHTHTQPVLSDNYNPPLKQIKHKTSNSKFRPAAPLEQSGDGTELSGAMRRSFSSRDQLLPQRNSHAESGPPRRQEPEPRHLPLQLYGSFPIRYHCTSKSERSCCDLKKPTRRKEGRTHRRRKFTQLHRTHT